MNKKYARYLFVRAGILFFLVLMLSEHREEKVIVSGRGVPDIRLKTGYFPRGRQLTAFLLAVVLSLLPVLSVEFGAFTSWADGEGRGETYTYYGTQNLL